MASDPIEALVASLPVGPQSVFHLRPNLTAYAGLNPGLAAFVSLTTGDEIVGDYRTVGFLDADDGALALVIHGCDEQGRARLSFADCGFRHCRDALMVVGVALLDEMEVASVFVRVRPADLSARSALARMGFVPAGREYLHDGERIVLRLGLDTIPDHWRRWRQRRSS